MTFQKYSLKTQLVLAFIFGPLNFLVSVIFNEVLHVPLFMDMIFVNAASFFGIPCGIITGILQTFFCAIIFQHNLVHMMYSLCCITETLLIWLLIIRHETPSWTRLVLLVFVSAFIISAEGAIIYNLFFSGNVNYQENEVVMFLIYNLILQNLSMNLSAFFARLPVNLIDKAIAVFAGFGIFLWVRKIIKKMTERF